MKTPKKPTSKKPNTKRVMKKPVTGKVSDDDLKHVSGGVSLNYSKINWTYTPTDSK